MKLTNNNKHQHTTTTTRTKVMEEETTNNNEIIKLNIGGVLYSTTSSTLLSKGENYFSGLLSGRFRNLKDENGAYFIDRNGSYFAPILDFLRTGRLLRLSKELDEDAFMEECRFFAIESLVKHLDSMETQGETKDEPDQDAANRLLRFDGYYWLEDESGQPTFAVSFSPNSGLVFAKGKHARNNISVFKATLSLPTLWRAEPLSTHYALFVESSIRRGIYRSEGPNLKLTLSQQTNGDVLMARAAKDHLYIMFSKGQFERLAFSLWDLERYGR